MKNQDNQEWVKSKKWTAKDLDGKSVGFKLFAENEGWIYGEGVLHAWEMNGLIKVLIRSHDSAKPNLQIKHSMDIYVPANAVDLIEKSTPECHFPNCDFYFFDSRE